MVRLFSQYRFLGVFERVIDVGLEAHRAVRAEPQAGQPQRPFDLGGDMRQEHLDRIVLAHSPDL